MSQPGKTPHCTHDHVMQHCQASDGRQGMSMIDHELRQTLNDELHGRPGQPVAAPARITHLAFTLEPGDADPLIKVRALCDALGVKPPPADTPHHAAQTKDGLLKYERHSEFYRISVTVQGSGNGNGNGKEAISSLPLGWLDGLPGKRLVAIHTQILDARTRQLTPAQLRKVFGHDEIACSRVNQGKATVWTDFRIGEDGYTRMIVHENGLAPLRLGRLSRRLHEIETYRMMALLAFPMARRMQAELGALENSLSASINDMSSVRGAKEDAEMLARLSAVARDVEDMSNRASFRFAASRAYAGLVAKRLVELGEERAESYQRLGVFLERRFSPAMATCSAVSERIASLATRTERASNLLRTRVDIALEGQNQQLLRSMEQRARQQLRLQETVEGLSVAAISYYAIGIVSKLLESLGHYAPVLNEKAVMLIVIPAVIVGVWWSVRRVRHRIHAAAQTRKEQSD